MHLFVYGTLLSDIPSSMSKFLRRRSTLLGGATTSGTLYDLGQYPGFVAGGDGAVRGELYLLEAERQEQTIEMLDAYEGVTGKPEDEYQRVEITVHLNDGGSFRAQTYAFTKTLADQPVIPGGNYPAYYVGNKAHERFVNGE